MDAFLVVVSLVVAAALVWSVQALWPKPQIVREHQRGLLYRKGRLLGERAPGRYWLRRRVDELVVVDVRRRQMVIAGQEALTADRVRSAYADVIEARQHGLAALERARGESAAVRNLANAAQLVEKHPGIMQLRLLQAVETGTGNRVVIALDGERGRAAAVEAEGG